MRGAGREQIRRDVTDEQPSSSGWIGTIVELIWTAVH
jgi:hypothetical protein